MDQTLAAVPKDSAAREHRRRQVVAGAYPARHEPPVVTIAAMGAVITEALSAADRLDAMGLGADVVCVTSPGLVFRALQARQGRQKGSDWILKQAFPARRARPLVTVLDGHPHTLAFLASVNNVRSTSLGGTSFGQSGTIEDLHRFPGLDTDSVVGAALDLID
ncbi:transketolase-like TK C-terminal-containing protein [Streptomyces lunaelactis]|uniref:transketolase-like TK C-terminal-containing protein n=1 Tax=Streptomyces lunaelactis TaxID=1535768 RepID=UPI00158482B0|nr:hypothetical protein [Streptomyces lunaelactis]NUL06004.1 hypothetical protein [Streptomyces lunaelactis]